MAFQSTPNMAEAAVIWSNNGRTCSMTFGFLKSGGYTQSDIDDLATEMDNWASAEFVPLLTSTSTYLHTDVRGLEEPNDMTGFADAGSAIGGSGAEPMNNASCFAVKRRSALTGRSARGRVYFPISQDYLAGNEDFITSTVRDLIVAALNEVLTAGITAGWTHVIVSRRAAGALRSVAIPFTVIEYVAVNDAIDTQRRRGSN